MQWSRPRNQAGGDSNLPAQTAHQATAGMSLSVVCFRQISDSGFMKVGPSRTLTRSRHGQPALRQATAPYIGRLMTPDARKLPRKPMPPNPPPRRTLQVSNALSQGLVTACPSGPPTPMASRPQRADCATSVVVHLSKAPGPMHRRASHNVAVMMLRPCRCRFAAQIAAPLAVKRRTF